MAMASLSPTSILASPMQVNPQVKSDLQMSVPQIAQDAQKAAQIEQTDTITISAQALKMADAKNAVAKETANRADEQLAMRLAGDKSDAAVQSEAQRNAVKTYAAVSANR